MRIRPIPLLACTLALAAFGRPALADPGLSRVEVHVSSEGLDLASQAGADQFLQRLSRAATEACGGAPDGSPLIKRPVRKFRQCRIAALAAAVAGSRSRMVWREFGATLEAESVRLAGF
jgi:UrcA family protein